MDVRKVASWIRKATPAPPHNRSSRHTATRARELNHALAELWQAEGTHDKAAFNTHIVPIYTTLLTALQQHNTTEQAEQALLDLLKHTTAACHYRWTLRLPMKRPGSDYRKYEIIYTYALLTAMAVGRLREVAGPGSAPITQLAARILPESGLTRLQRDAIVWDDWLGYFEAAERGGLYAVSHRSQLGKPPNTEQGANTETAPRQAPARAAPRGSGKAMLAAIRSALEAGTLAYNGPDDPVQVDREGRTYLVHPTILEWCKATLQLDDDTKRLENRFARLKIFTRSARGHVLYRGRWRAQDAYSQGYLVENAAVLWRDKAPQGHFVIENISPKR
tara:strand:+ start:10543 stop:11544 length:1002 start_codon:yes stop_codon:yes gene_type:complete